MKGWTDKLAISIPPPSCVDASGQEQSKKNGFRNSSWTNTMSKNSPRTDIRWMTVDKRATIYCQSACAWTRCSIKIYSGSILFTVFIVPETVYKFMSSRSKCAFLICKGVILNWGVSTSSIWSDRIMKYEWLIWMPHTFNERRSIRNKRKNYCYTSYFCEILSQSKLQKKEDENIFNS